MANNDHDDDCEECDFCKKSDAPCIHICRTCIGGGLKHAGIAMEVARPGERTVRQVHRALLLKGFLYAAQPLYQPGLFDVKTAPCFLCRALDPEGPLTIITSGQFIELRDPNNWTKISNKRVCEPCGRFCAKNDHLLLALTRQYRQKNDGQNFRVDES